MLERAVASIGEFPLCFASGALTGTTIWLTLGMLARREWGCGRKLCTMYVALVALVLDVAMMGSCAKGEIVDGAVMVVLAVMHAWVAVNGDCVRVPVQVAPER